MIRYDPYEGKYVETPETQTWINTPTPPVRVAQVVDLDYGTIERIADAVVRKLREQNEKD